MTSAYENKGISYIIVISTRLNFHSTALVLGHELFKIKKGRFDLVISETRAGAVRTAGLNNDRLRSVTAALYTTFNKIPLSCSYLPMATPKNAMSS
jgi:hypothetical protein